MYLRRNAYLHGYLLIGRKIQKIKKSARVTLHILPTVVFSFRPRRFVIMTFERVDVETSLKNVTILDHVIRVCAFDFESVKREILNQFKTRQVVFLSPSSENTFDDLRKIALLSSFVNLFVTLYYVILPRCRVHDVSASLLISRNGHRWRISNIFPEKQYVFQRRYSFIHIKNEC